MGCVMGHERERKTPPPAVSDELRKDSRDAGFTSAKSGPAPVTSNQFTRRRGRRQIHFYYRHKKRACVTPGQGGAAPRKGGLLDFDSCASLGELLLDCRGFFLVHTLLDRLGGAIDEVFGLLETEAGDLANGLDDIDLVGARRNQNDVKLISNLSIARLNSDGF